MLSFPRVIVGLILLSLAVGHASGLQAQEPKAERLLGGRVVDPSGARVPHAAVAILGASGPIDTSTDDRGEFAVSVPDGDYTVTVEAPGFRRNTTQVPQAALESGQRLRIWLSIATKDEQVEVDRDSSTTAAGDNQSATVLGERELMALSNDEATFQKQLLSMVATLNGAPAIYVDGFSGGKIPPKSSILSVRISHDPYSAQYDALGFGRVEIDSKAGGPKLHGEAGIGGTQQSFNGLDPFTPAPQPSYYVLNTDGNLNGPLDHKSTFFVSGAYNDQQSNAAVNALVPTLYSVAVPNPQRTASATARTDREFSSSNRIALRYQLDHVTLTNGGVGQLVLPSQGHASATGTQTLQLSQETLPTSYTVNQLRFEYIRTRLDQHPELTSTGLCNTPQTPSCTVLVQGSFAGGGDPAQSLQMHGDHLEAEDSFSLELPSHFLRFGARYRWNRQSSTSTAGYNGQFVFASLADYSAGQPSQFSLAAGNPSAVASTSDLGVYAEDEWSPRKGLTLDYGLRLESQTGVHDKLDAAPRAGIGWAVGRRNARSPLVTLRAGAGIFYDRFPVDNLLTAAHENGVLEQIAFVSDATTLRNYYTSGFTSAAASSGQPTTYRVDPSLKSSYDFIGTLAAERRMNRVGVVSVTYLWARGVHQYLSENENAPAPGTGIRPQGGNSNLYVFAAEGTEKDQEGRIAWRFTRIPRVTLFGQYIVQDKRSSGQSPTTFVSNSYDVSQDFGRMLSSRRQILFADAIVSLPWGISGNAFLSAQAGAPFNITTGTDLNGDSIYNDRPSFATSASPSASVVSTAYGRFNLTPVAGETIIPINYGTGPALFYLSTSLSRDFVLGGHLAPAAAGRPAHRDGGLHLNLSAEADNVTNHTNAGPPDGVLSSPLFGKSLAQDPTYSASSAANRVVLLRANISF